MFEFLRNPRAFVMSFWTLGVGATDQFPKDRDPKNSLIDNKPVITLVSDQAVRVSLENAAEAATTEHADRARASQGSGRVR